MMARHHDSVRTASLPRRVKKSEPTRINRHFRRTSRFGGALGRGTLSGLSGATHRRQSPSRRRTLEGVGALALLAAAACTGTIESKATGDGATGAGATSATGGGAGTTGAAASSQGGSAAGTGKSGGGGGTSGTSGSSSGTAGASGTGTTPAACTGATPDTDANVLRRLSVLEYQRTVQSLLKLDAPPSTDGIPVDNERLGFRTYAEFQTMSAENLRAYLEKAHGLATELLADSARRTTVLGCQTSASGCLGSFVTSFGKLAFRRPLEQSEVDAITSAATANASDADDQFRFAIEVLLSSPSFLFRVEVGNSPEGLSTLSATELASRLSFALLGSGPSAALLDQAAAGKLDTPDGLHEVAASMLADPAAQGFFSAFFRQWLGFNTLRAPVKPPTDWSDTLLPMMQAETDKVVQDFAWGGSSLLGMLTANYTTLDPALAKFYGLAAPASNGRLDFPAGNIREKSGVLTHASLLEAKSDGDLIAIRGNWLRKTFLCEELAPPPDLADQIGDLLVGLTRTEIVNKRNSMTQCQGCHAAIDPIGMGFAQFDATGRFDSTIDVSGIMVAPALPDADTDPAFSTPAELAQKLAALPGVPACVANRAFLYVNGREPGAADTCTLASATTAFSSASQSFPALLAGIVEAPAFRMRRAPAATP